MNGPKRGDEGLERRPDVRTRHAPDLRLVLALALAGLHVPEAACLLEVGRVDRQTGLAGITGHAAERVVELVQQLHLAHAHVVDLVQLHVDLVLVARGHVDHDVAVQGLGGLDPQDHRQLAGLDHPARLARALHDPEPALAGPAPLGVDVVLQLVHVGDLPAHRVHLVAVLVVATARVGVAQRLVVGVEGHVHPQPAHPRPLQPAVVHLLEGQRVVLGPVLERRPPDRVVRRHRVAVVEVVLHRRGRPLRALEVLAVGQRELDAEAVPGAPAVEVAAQGLEEHQVLVGLHEAHDVAVLGALERLAGGVDRRLRVLLAVLGALEQEADRVLLVIGVDEPEVAGVRVGGHHLVGLPRIQRVAPLLAQGDLPHRLVAGLVVDPHVVALGGHEVAALAVQQVFAQPGGLQAEGLGIRRLLCGRAVAAVAVLHHRQFQLPRAQRIAAVGQLVRGLAAHLAVARALAQRGQRRAAAILGGALPEVLQEPLQAVLVGGGQRGQRHQRHHCNRDNADDPHQAHRPHLSLVRRPSRRTVKLM